MPSPPQPAAAPSGGHRRKKAAVGDYVGLVAAEAIEAARAAGLRPAPERVEVGEPGQAGLIFAQEPRAGSPAPRNTVITLQVGDLAGAPVEDAEPAATQQTEPSASSWADDPREADDLGDVTDEFPTNEWEESPEPVAADAPARRAVAPLRARRSRRIARWLAAGACGAVGCLIAVALAQQPRARPVRDHIRQHKSGKPSPDHRGAAIHAQRGRTSSSRRAHPPRAPLRKPRHRADRDDQRPPPLPSSIRPPPQWRPDPEAAEFF